jgi:hypothetical protein
MKPIGSDAPRQGALTHQGGVVQTHEPIRSSKFQDSSFEPDAPPHRWGECPHQPGEEVSSPGCAYAGGVRADSPGLARERLPGDWLAGRDAPRRRCEDLRLLQPLAGLAFHCGGFPEVTLRDPGYPLQRLRRIHTNGHWLQVAEPERTSPPRPNHALSHGLPAGRIGGSLKAVLSSRST